MYRLWGSAFEGKKKIKNKAKKENNRHQDNKQWKWCAFFYGHNFFYLFYGLGIVEFDYAARFLRAEKKMDPRAVNFNSKQIHKFRCFNVAWSADTNGWFGKQINALFVVLRFQSKVNIDTFARKRLFFSR